MDSIKESCSYTDCDIIWDFEDAERSRKRSRFNTNSTDIECSISGVPSNSQNTWIPSVAVVSPQASAAVATKDTADVSAYHGNVVFTDSEGKEHASQDVRSDVLDSSICLGLFNTASLRVSPSARKDLPCGKCRVALRPQGDTTTVHLITNGKLLGFLDAVTAQALEYVNREFKVLVDSFLSANVESSDPTKDWEMRSMLIVAYSNSGEADAVGELFAQHCLFLQHPTSIDIVAPYRNPQFFVRPGQDFPLIEESRALLTNEAQVEAHECVGVDRHQIDEIFHTAQGPETYRKVAQSPRLATPLQEHQKKALAMMSEKEAGRLQNTDFAVLWTRTTLQGGYQAYKNVVNGAVKTNPDLCLGGLLADDMGLGKTLTMIALIAGSLDAQELSQSPSVRDEESVGILRSVKATLIVTPKSTFQSWEEQLGKHVRPGSLEYCCYHGKHRSTHLSHIDDYDIVITTYGTLNFEKNRKSKQTKSEKNLYSFKWSRVVLDEAHVIRNPATAQSGAVCHLKATHRWCLTGTPVQNRLSDFGALLRFLKVSPFDNLATFTHDVTEAMERGETNGTGRLRQLVHAVCLRRTKKCLNLPIRKDRIEKLVMSPEEQKLYELCRSSTVDKIESAINEEERNNLVSFAAVLQLILRLRQIADHGKELLPYSIWKRLQQTSSTGSSQKMSFKTEESAKCEVCISEVSSNLEILECMHIVCSDCLNKSRINLHELNEDCPICAQVDSDIPIPKSQERGDCVLDRLVDQYEASTKVKALLANLARATSGDPTPDKSVVFSEWTKMLDLIGKALRLSKIYFVRLDGKMTWQQRKRAIEEFRGNPRCVVLLASIRSAGVGIDLTAACHVHLMEPQWNPMGEEQALDRVHRIGQHRTVTATRYIVQGSIEEYIVSTHDKKLNIIQQSFGDKGADRVGLLRAKLKSLHSFLSKAETDSGSFANKSWERDHSTC